jgi:transposase InsO family protein
MSNQPLPLCAGGVSEAHRARGCAPPRNGDECAQLAPLPRHRHRLERLLAPRTTPRRTRSARRTSRRDLRGQIRARRRRPDLRHPAGRRSAHHSAARPHNRSQRGKHSCPVRCVADRWCGDINRPACGGARRRRCCGRGSGELERRLAFSRSCSPAGTSTVGALAWLAVLRAMTVLPSCCLILKSGQPHR